MTHDHENLGEILLLQNRAQQALAAMEQEPAEYWRLTGEVLVHHALGRRQDSNAALKKLITIHQNFMSYQIAEVYAYRGESDKAFEWLNLAYQRRDSGLLMLKSDPLLNRLRQDSRYLEMLEKMHLTT